jgi:hypothetical protein
MRRALLLVTALLAMAALVGPVGAWYPRTTQVEMATATWCVNCPDADQGIDVNKDTFGRHEFNAIRYYDATGDFGNATSTARLAYYAMAGAGYPTGIFDGLIRVPRGDDVIAQGDLYRDAIESLLDDPTYFKLTVTSVSFTPPTGSISLDLEVMEDVPSIAGMFLRIMIAEDGLVWNSEIHDDVCRGSVPDANGIAVTVNQYGQVQHVTRTFAIDPAWVPANLHILAFVQQDTDKSVYASVSTLPQTSHQLRYFALGPKVVVGDSNLPVPHGFEIFQVVNTGTVADEFNMHTVFAGPGDWSAVLCDPYGVCYGPDFATTLYPGEYAELIVDMWPHSSGFGVATVELSQDGAAGVVRSFQNEYITNDYAEVLLVDDDGLATYDDYFTDALTHFGHAYAVWKRSAGGPTFDDLMYFPAIVWNLGRSHPTLDANDRAALGSYLDVGGRVCFSGQDLGKELNDAGGGAYTWYQQQLHARFVNDNSGDRTLVGVADDPISDGIDLTIEGGDGAGNQLYPDRIDANDAYATPIFKYDSTWKGAIRADDGNDKVVVLGFGFEAIDNADARRVVLHRILRWFQGVQDTPEDAPAFARALSSYPSVSRASSTVRFTLPASGETRLQVFSTDGRLVRTLANGMLAAGPHALSWDGTNAHGARVPAGVYCYRLQGAGTDLQQKMVRVN